LQSGPEAAARDALRQPAAGRDAAPRAGQPTQAILDDLGPDLGQLGDLVADRLGVVTVEVEPATGAAARPAVDRIGEPRGRDQLAGVALMPGRPARSPPGARPGRPPLDVQGLARRRLRRVGRVPRAARLEGGDPLLEGLDQGQDRFPDIGGGPVPEVRG
jgi:hypothetical protein